MGLQKLTLVLGGAASGKSAYAEGLIRASGLSRVYLATTELRDDETRARLERHRAQRGPGWRLIEEPLNLGPALATCREGEAVLLDCATLWLTNHLLADHDLEAEAARLFDALAACPCPVVVVSNETGMGIVPENALARRFREAQGRLNIALAERSDFVVLVAAGLPLVMKGRAT